MSEILLPMLSSSIFMVLWLALTPFTHLEFILVCGVSWCPSFIFCTHLSSSPAPGIEKTVFTLLYVLTLKIFFKDSFNTFAHFMVGDLWAQLTTPHWVVSSFWPKWAGPCAPPSQFAWSHPGFFFFASPDEKSPQSEMFCPRRRVEKENNGNINTYINFHASIDNKLRFFLLWKT